MWGELPNKGKEEFRKEKKNHFQIFKCNIVEDTGIFFFFLSSLLHNQTRMPELFKGHFWILQLSLTHHLESWKGMRGHVPCYRLCMSLPRAELSAHLGLFNNWLEISPSDFQLNTGHRKTNSTCFSLSLVSHPNCSADQRTACGLVAEAQNS